METFALIMTGFSYGMFGYHWCYTNKTHEMTGWAVMMAVFANSL